MGKYGLHTSRHIWRLAQGKVWNKTVFYWKDEGFLSVKLICLSIDAILFLRYWLILLSSVYYITKVGISVKFQILYYSYRWGVTKDTWNRFISNFIINIDCMLGCVCVWGGLLLNT